MIIRKADVADAEGMADILNRIILIGGTTAHEQEFSIAKVTRHYINGTAVICCHVAEEAGQIIGFQAVDRHPELPAGWGDIGTFVDPDVQRSGAGALLFQATCDATRAAGLTAINATIRADNAPGLGYYARRGFQDYATDPDYVLADGARVGRVSKRFDLV
jgi:L-amino acid N-acyltransferase YncA